MILQDILNGKLPDVPLKVSVDDRSILKLAVAAVMVAAIIMLSAVLLRQKK